MHTICKAINSLEFPEQYLMVSGDLKLWQSLYK